MRSPQRQLSHLKCHTLQDIEPVYLITCLAGRTGARQSACAGRWQTGGGGAAAAPPSPGWPLSRPPGRPRPPSAHQAPAAPDSGFRKALPHVHTTHCTPTLLYTPCQVRSSTSCTGSGQSPPCTSNKANTSVERHRLQDRHQPSVSGGAPAGRRWRRMCAHAWPPAPPPARPFPLLPLRPLRFPEPLARQ